MDLQTLVKASSITQGVLVGTMVGIVIYGNYYNRKAKRTMEQIDAQLARGEELMKNWHRMPTSY